MDYCVPCRRTLNGTVTCPECGAYDSGLQPPSDRAAEAPAIGTAAMEVLLNEGPGPVEPPDVPRHAADPAAVPATLPPSAAVPTARARSATVAVPQLQRHRPPRWKKYGGRALAAATFAILGGLATASLLPDRSAGAPQAAPSPDQASPDEPQEEATEPPKASRSPERTATRPARGTARDRNKGVTRRPLATPTPPKPPASKAPTSAPAPPPAKVTPTPSPSSGRPSKSPPATTTPSPSPTGSVSASPTGSPAPSTPGAPVTVAPGERAARTGPLLGNLLPIVTGGGR
ncbi:SCO2400 family protein [Streptomyces agglomeratus]|uniref:SCO2400 family protein n=1 Tax=Streptomyces agglomeratus TaxID=285458 RepID=UPI0026B1D458